MFNDFIHAYAVSREILKILAPRGSFFFLMLPSPYSENSPPEDGSKMYLDDL